MHLGIDDAWQDMQAHRADGLPSDAIANVADRGDAAVPHAEIGEAFAGLVDDGPALEHEIEGFSQGLKLCFPSGVPPPPTHFRGLGSRRAGYEPLPCGASSTAWRDPRRGN